MMFKVSIYIKRCFNLVIEQEKYGEILTEIIHRTNEEEIRTSEQLIRALIDELKMKNKAS